MSFSSLISISNHYLTINLTLIGIKGIDRLLELGDHFNALLSLKGLVSGQVLLQLLGTEGAERSVVDVGLVAEELVYRVLVFHRLEDVRCQRHNHLKGLIEEVRFEA
jgi:hypothetical protein